MEDGYYDPEPDVEGAIELLKSAGYKFDENGRLSAETPIKLEYLTNMTPTNIEIAECVQMDLAEVGIEMSIRTIEQNILLGEKRSGNYEISSASWWADFNDPINMLEMWTTNSGNNYTQFGR